MTFELSLTIISVVLMGIFLKNLLAILFRMENDGASRKRLKSLNYDGSRIGQSDEDGTREFLQKVSDPIIKYVLPHFKFKDNKQINEDLDFVGWGKYMRAEQFRALTIIMRGIGVVILIAVWNIIWPIAVILGSTFMLGLPFFLKMEVDDKKSKMIGDFPEIIRLIQGYLAASQTLTESMEHTLPYIAESWRPILEDFVKNSRTRNEKAALEQMKNDVRIPEVRELLSLISLSMDQGTDMYLAFESQHEKVKSMQYTAMLAKIHSRQNMAIMVQYPMLLMIFVALGLPMFDMIMGM